MDKYTKAVLIVVGCCLVLTGCQQNASHTTVSMIDKVGPYSVDHLEKPLTLEDAIHLESRAGLGAPQNRVERLVGLTRREGINLVLEDLDNAGTRSNPLPPWMDHPSIGFFKWSWKESWRDCNALTADQYIQSVELSWINKMLISETPAHERLVLLFSNLFVSDFKTYKSAETYAQHHKIIRDNSAGSMRSFLLSVLKDPAILVYLNNDVNTRANINENFAREFLELFSLGEGNYTEKDVRNLSLILAGESVNPISQRYQQFRSAKTTIPRQVLGTEIKTSEEVVELVLAQEAHALFLAKYFYKTYISVDSPNTKTLNWIAKQYRDSDFDIKDLLRATLQSIDFWSQDNRLNLVKDPVDIVIGTLRSVGYSNNSDIDYLDIRNALAQMDFSLVNPPNVAGYSGGMSWIEGGLLGIRKEVLTRLIAADKEKTDFQQMLKHHKDALSASREKENTYKRKLEQLKSNAPPDQLIVEKVSLMNASEDMLGNRYPSLKINLSGVHLGGRYWSGIQFRLGLNRKHNYSRIEIYENSCNPACISNFNEGWDSDWLGIKGFDVDPVTSGGPTKSLQRRWASISGTDRLLLKRLYQFVHFVPHQMMNGRALSRSGQSNTKAWGKWLKDQRERMPLNKLQTKDGTQYDPIVRVPGDVCGSVLATSHDLQWSRPLNDVPTWLNRSGDKLNEWVPKLLPTAYQTKAQNTLRQVIVSDAFQLK